jgi:hypothetical protein
MMIAKMSKKCASYTMKFNNISITSSKYGILLNDENSTLILDHQKYLISHLPSPSCQGLL